MINNLNSRVWHRGPVHLVVHLHCPGDMHVPPFAQGGVHIAGQIGTIVAGIYKRTCMA